MRIVLAGFGVVGRGFMQLLEEKRAHLARAYGFVPRVVAVLDSSGYASDEKGLDVGRLLRAKTRTGRVGSSTTPSGAELISETDAEVLVEATPTSFRTGEPGLSHIRAAFQSKKHVVTCNKGPLGVAFHALQELARYNSVQFRYSGAVGGGTPVLDFGKTCSTGDEVTRVTGILNGTCNFILTKMENEGLGFEDALRLAQAEGYAEKDPTLDINGNDSAVKIAIIANHLGLSRATVSDVRVTGIEGISAEKVNEARAKGKAVRLIATAGEELSVQPLTIAREDPICVSGAYNAVKFECRSSGPKVIVGKGAGGPETASSMLRDLIEIRAIIGGTRDA